MNAGSTLIISDIHTRFEVVNAQLRHAREDLGHQVESVFVLGDFGFFRQELNDWFRRKEQRFDRPVYCIEGNHEDFSELENLAQEFADVFTHQGRGSILDLGPWRGLCLGGARYMDASSTPSGCEITRNNLEACLIHASDEVDLILTHECPTHIQVPQTPGLEHYGPTGMPALGELAGRYQPHFWFFGHHHRWFDKTQEGTRYIGLPGGWEGYVLLGPDPELRLVENQVEPPRPPWWKRLF